MKNELSTNKEEERKKLIKLLRAGDSQAFEAMNRLHFKKIYSYIKNNSGALIDAQDIFQESLIVLVLNLRKRDFELTSDPGTYLYSIAKRKWLYHLRSRKIMVSMEDQKGYLTELEEDGVTVKKQYDQKTVLAYEVLKQIGESCKQLLEYAFFQRLSHFEIAEKMNYTVGTIKNKKFRCIEKYQKLLKKHPNYSKIFD